MNLLTLIAKGGIIVWIIIFLSFLGLAIFLERWRTLNRAKKITLELSEKLKILIKQGNIKEGMALATQLGGPVSDVFRVCLENFDKSREVVKTYIEEQANLEIYNLEKNLNILGAISGIAPMLGFLGTVTGMIRAFMTIQALGGNVDASVLAGGIWEALVTTAVGLSVGIPFYFLYNWLVGKTEEVVFFMSKTALEILELKEVIPSRGANEI